ncbi:MAG: autotransporter outer membrane beta-barrel domain-containing protein [Rhizobiaceae bacterium]|nr:autotransporter outer membrane beta-barrel domain-containing protein [Rhizobiaceae bacterium]
MISYLQRRTKLRKSISAVALLAALPHALVANAAMAQEVVTENTSGGLSYSDIISFTNPGFTITNYSGTAGVFVDGDVDEDFSNSGFIAGDTYGVYVGGYVGGNFTNSGTIEGSYGVLIDDYVGGSFTNSGDIRGDRYYGVWISDDLDGDFTNTSTGEIRGQRYYGVIINGDVGGNFVNNGEISGEYYGVYIEDDLNGNFTNTGNITARDNDEGYGVWVQGNFGGADREFTNSGDIVGGETGVFIAEDYLEGSVSSYGDQVGSNFTGDFTNSGNITGKDGDGVFVQGDFVGNFTNSGDISGEDHGFYVGVDEWVSFGGSGYTLTRGNFTGEFDNSGSITGDNSYGVFVTGKFNGNFTNSGDISGSEYGVGVGDDMTGNFTNSGNITADDEYGYGVILQGDLNGEFFNSGKISGDGYGVFIYDNLNGNFTNSGNISGDTYGVYVGGEVNGDFVNSGNITSDDYAVFIGNDLDGDFTNSGNISGDDEYGVYVAGDIKGSFTNSGNITSEEYAVYIEDHVDDDFTNTGRLDGGSYGVVIYGDVGGNFTNEGTILGSQYGVVINGDLDDDFTNSGNITSDHYGVHFGTYVGGDFTNSGNITGGYYGVFFTNGLDGDFVNSGNIRTFGDEYYGVRIDTEFSGDFTNSGNIIATNPYAVYFNGNVTGDFMNSGNISAEEHAVFFDADFTANFTNTGVLTSTNDDYAVRASNNFTGDFVNMGDIVGEHYLATYLRDFTGNLTTPVNQGVATTFADIRGKTVTAYVDGFYKDGTEWTALDASGDLDSDGSGGQSVDDTSALMDVYIETLDSSELVLGLDANDINEVAGGEAGGLGLLGLAAGLIDDLENDDPVTVEERALVDALYRQGSATGVAGVLADYSPSGSRGSAAGSYAANQQLMDTLASRLGGSGNGSSNTATFGMANTNKGPSNGSSQWWIQGFGGIGDLSNDGVVGGYDLQTVGVGFGVEAETGDGMLVGAAFAVAGTNFDGSAASGDVVSYMPAIYGRFQKGDWYMSGVASGAFNQIDQSRFNSTANETLTADYSGGQANLRAEGGYDFKANGTTVTPFLAGTFGYVKTGAYDEQGGSTALSVGSSSDTHFLMEAGSRISATHGATTFNAVAGWREDFGTLDTTVSANLQNSASFTSTYDINVSGFFGGVGFTMMTAQDFEFEAGVSGIVGSDYSSIDGQLGLKKKF